MRERRAQLDRSALGRCLTGSEVPSGRRARPERQGAGREPVRGEVRRGSADRRKRGGVGRVRLGSAAIFYVGGHEAQELAGEEHHVLFSEPALAQLAVDRLGEDAQRSSVVRCLLEPHRYRRGDVAQETKIGRCCHGWLPSRVPFVARPPCGFYAKHPIRNLNGKPPKTMSFPGFNLERRERCCALRVRTARRSLRGTMCVRPRASGAGVHVA